MPLMDGVISSFVDDSPSTHSEVDARKSNRNTSPAVVNVDMPPPLSDDSCQSMSADSISGVVDDMDADIQPCRDALAAAEVNDSVYTNTASSPSQPLEITERRATDLGLVESYTLPSLAVVEKHAVDDQSKAHLDATPVTAVEDHHRMEAAHMSTESSSIELSQMGYSLAADGGVKVDAANKDACDVVLRRHDKSSSVCHVPVMSLSCSALANRLGGYVPSPGPLAQMYGGSEATSASQTPSPSTACSGRNCSSLAYSPLKVGGDVSEITAKISAARSCTRSGAVQSSVAVDNRRWTDSFRFGLRAADSTSTPWLSVGERSMDNFRSPGVAHSSSVCGSLSENRSLTLSSSLSMTPLASRCSSLVSTDSSTLHTSTLVPDNSCMFIFSPFMRRHISNFFCHIVKRFL